MKRKMRFRCPRCKTAYELPAASLPKPEGRDDERRRLRCCRCQSVFMISVDFCVTEPRHDGAAVYYEMIRPDELPQIKFAVDAFRSGTGVSPNYIRYEVSETVNGDPPHASDIASVSGISRWRSDTVLELSDYEIGRFQRIANARLSVFWGGLVVFIVFVVFVARANDWRIRVDRLPMQIRVAFGMENQSDQRTMLVEQMAVSLHRGYLLTLKSGGQVGVVKGQIQNNATTDVSTVKLEGVILDSRKNVVARTRTFCGRPLKDRRIRAMSHRQIAQFNRAEHRQCPINSGFSTDFKILFTDLPEGFDDQFTFQVHVLFVR